MKLKMQLAYQKLKEDQLDRATKNIIQKEAQRTEVDVRIKIWRSILKRSR